MALSWISPDIFVYATETNTIEATPNKVAYDNLLTDLFFRAQYIDNSGGFRETRYQKYCPFCYIVINR